MSKTKRTFFFFHPTFFSLVLISFLSVHFHCQSREIAARPEHTKRLQAIKELKQWWFKIPAEYAGLSDTLLQVYYDDQLYRDNQNLAYLSANLEEQKRLDKKNQAIVTSVLKRYGFLDMKTVGFSSSQAILSTLQHSPYAMRKEFETTIDSAMSRKAIMPSAFANYKDRLLLNEQHLQLYGSQVVQHKGAWVLYPTDLRKVDSLRKSIGMIEKLSYYLEYNFKIKLDSAAYQKQLPALMAELGIKDTLSN